ncbi:MAG: hypothetical protein D6677_06770 [Calditrichaeota bacterium]|nr:MAG: hypothetical protein D6677_06770 [Calditrichota bacterium]
MNHSTKRVILLLTLCITGLLFSCSSYKNSEQGVATYDSIKANAYGADDYGMKKYVMAFLKRGPNRVNDSIEVARLQKFHLENIERLANEGKLVLAGPFLDNNDLRGIYIFNVSTVEEAKKLTESDPMIQSGHLIMELKPWYGSAAIMEVGALHKTLQKKHITD